MNKPADMDQYIQDFPKEIQVILERLRSTIRNAAPEAEEAISYGIPTFKLKGNLVHFGAFKHHIGFYPTSSATAAFANELSVYKGSKGAVQFPLDQPLPTDLITQIVKFRVIENLAKAERKINKRQYYANWVDPKILTGVGDE